MGRATGVPHSEVHYIFCAVSVHIEIGDTLKQFMISTDNRRRSAFEVLKQAGHRSVWRSQVPLCGCYVYIESYFNIEIGSIAMSADVMFVAPIIRLPKTTKE